MSNWEQYFPPEAPEYFNTEKAAIKPPKWVVKPNRCNCHPETCCCDDWAVYSPSGEKELTFFNKHHADEWVEFKNKG